MDNRSLEANASANPPAAPGAPSVGYPKAGNPQTNDPASKPGPYWFYAIGEELRAVIAAGGLVPAANNLTQVRDAIQVMINASLPADALVFKGVINCSANPNYPAGDAGHVYRVSVAGKIGGAAGPNVEAGDMLTCLTDGSAVGDHATVGANWNITQVNIDGVIGSSVVVHKNANYAIAQADNGKVLVADTALDFTLPLISGLTLPFEMTIKLGAATGTSMGAVCSGTDKIVAGGAELASTKTNVRGCLMKLVADLTGKWQAVAYRWEFESAELSISDNAVITAAHNLNTRPNWHTVHHRCKTAELGYAVDDEVPIGNIDNGAGGEKTSWADAINVGFAQKTSVLVNRSTFAANTMTNASWKAVARAGL